MAWLIVVAPLFKPAVRPVEPALARRPVGPRHLAEEAALSRRAVAVAVTFGVGVVVGRIGDRECESRGGFALAAARYET